MAKKQENAEIQQLSGRIEKYQISPTSEYFIYGRGGNDEYTREVRRIKAELRVKAYGERYAYENQEPEPKVRKKINGAAVTVLICGLLSLIIMIAGKFGSLNGYLYLTESKDAITLIAGTAKAFEVFGLGIEFGKGMFALLSVVLATLALLGGIIAIHSKGTGKVIRAGTFFWFVAEAILAILVLVAAESLTAGLSILMTLSLTAMLAAAFGGKKERRKG